MKLVHSELSGEILSDAITFTEWIIESPKYFSEYLQELRFQCEKGDGRFALSQGDHELEISKYVEVVIDPFAVDINSRKILNKLYTSLERISKEEAMYTKTLELTAYIHEYLMQLEQQTNYILSFDDNLEMVDILKAVGVRHEEMEDNFFEKLIRYVKIAVEILTTKVFVFVNIRSYLTDEQVQDLIQEAIYQDAKILFMENLERACMEGGMRYIIDRDGCEIY